MRKALKEWRFWLRLGQAIITIGLMALLIRSVEWSAFHPLIASLQWSFVVLSLFTVLFSHLVNIARWKYLLHPHPVRFRQLLTFYGAGLFSNNFLPTGIGGDSVRTALISRYVPLSHALFSVGMDRLLGLLALSVFVLPGMWYGIPAEWEAQVAQATSFDNTLWLLVLIGLVISSLTVWFIWCRLPRAQAFVETLFTKIVGDPNISLWSTAFWWQFVGGAFGISLVSNLGLVVTHWAVLQAVGIHISPGAAIWLTIVGAISFLLPIAVNGLGVMESAYVVLLAGYGVDAPAALGVALIIRMLILFYSLIGGLLSLPLGMYVRSEAIAEHSNK